jgi:hypothetical protein
VTRGTTQIDREALDRRERLGIDAIRGDRAGATDLDGVEAAP